jgi:hypothetical protein
MTTAEQTAKTNLRHESTLRLVAMFERTDSAILRGWIKNELLDRDREAFDAWLAAWLEDRSRSPRDFFLGTING